MPSSAAETFLGLDLGTTACKGMLVDRQMRPLAQAEGSCALITRSAEEIEQDAEQWQEVAGEVIRRILAEPAVDPSTVRSLSISAQGISFVPVDARDRPLRSALTWLDTRAREQAARAASELGEHALFSRTGKRVSSVYVLPKLLWLRDREPRLFSRTRRVLMAHEFLTTRLCGEAVTDHTMASGTMLYDIHLQEWAAPILEHFALDPALLPSLSWSGASAGTLLPDVARRLGLPADTRVVVGGQDQKVAALGAGLGPGRTTLSLGTAMAVMRPSAQPMIDPEMRVPCFSGLEPRRWVLEGSGIGTSCLDWARATLLGGRSFAELEAMAGSLDGKPNRLYFYPFLAGTDTLHRGDAVRAFLYGLDFSVGPERIVKSVHEGLAYQVREHLELLEELTEPGGSLRLFGGGARSAGWAQTIADVTGREVETLVSPEMGCMGAAVLAAVGAGAFRGPGEAAALIPVERRCTPRRELEAMYAEQYGEYLEIQRRMLAAGAGGAAGPGGAVGVGGAR